MKKIYKTSVKKYIKNQWNVYKTSTFFSSRWRAGAGVIKVFMTTFIILMIKKPCFTNSTSICYETHIDERLEFHETYVYPSLWVYKEERGLLDKKTHLMKVLLILAGDIELCPGPTRIKCFCCDKTIRKNQSIEKCTGCGQRCHLKCLRANFVRSVEKLYCNLCYVNNDENTDLNEEQVYPKLFNFTKRRGLKILHQNVNGIVKKLDQIKHFIAKCNKNIHIFGVTESHTNASTQDSELDIDGYHTDTKRQNNRTWRRYCLFYSKGSKLASRTDLERDGIECIWIELFLEKSRSILICIIYKPPDSSKHIDKNFITIFEDMLSTSVNQNKETIIAGDLNCNYLVANDHKDIKDIIKINGLKQVIKTPDAQYTN